MWMLVSTKQPVTQLIMLSDRPYSIGRQGADIQINDDKSISRKHATITITHSEANVGQPNNPATVTLEDLSKFGTLIKNERVSKGCHILKSGDTIKFGTMDSVFDLVYEPMIITTSCLDIKFKTEIKSLARNLAGHVVSNWRKECRMLIMSSLSVTVKVICALISQIPIVTIEYIKDAITAIGEKKELPDTTKYLPPLAESQLNANEVSFGKNKLRRKIFAGKTFIFLTPKQYKKLSIAVELGDGQAILMPARSADEENIITDPNTVVMSYEAEASQSSQVVTDWMRHVGSLLIKSGRRFIPDAELGYSVLYCSTSQYCNPTVEGPILTQISITPQSAQNQTPSQTINGQTLLPGQTVPTQSAVPSLRAVLNNDNKPLTNLPGTSTYTPSIGMNAARSLPESTLGSLAVKVEPLSQVPTPLLIKPLSQLPTPLHNVNSKKRPRSDDEHVVPVTKIQKKQVQDDEQWTCGACTFLNNVSVKKCEICDTENVSTQANTVVSTIAETVSANIQSAVVREIKEEEVTFVNRKRVNIDENENKRSTVLQTNNESTNDNELDSKKSRGKGAHSENYISHRSISPDRDEFDLPSRKIQKKPCIRSTEHDEFDHPDQQGRTSQKLTVAETVNMDEIKDEQSPTATHDIFDAPNQRSKMKINISPSTSEHPITSHEVVGNKFKLEHDLTQKKTNVTVIADSDEDDDNGRDVKVPTGFLSKSYSSGAVKSSDVFDAELDPNWKMGIGFKSMLRSIAPSASSITILSGGFSMWKGKRVKNFKRFAKTSNVGSNALPHIIGGADLEAHDRTGNKQMQEWLRDHDDTPTQRTESQRAADDLFTFNAAVPVGRRKR